MSDRVFGAKGQFVVVWQQGEELVHSRVAYRPEVVARLAGAISMLGFAIAGFEVMKGSSKDKEQYLDRFKDARGWRNQDSGGIVELFTTESHWLRPVLPQ